MEYRASLFAHKSFGYFVTSLCALFAFCFLAAGAYGAFAVFIVFVTLVLVRLRTRKMVFSQSSFHYDGWVTHFSIPFVEIRSVVPASKFGYPTDRIRGGQHCLITNSEKRHWVTLLWFPPAACSQFHQELVCRSHAENVA
jgi:hypothetical protein